MTRQPTQIFVSYSRRDEARVTPILAQLRERGFDLWLDQNAIHGGAPWRERVVEAILRCPVVLFFATRDSCHSVPVRNELAIATDERKPIVPVFLDNVPLPKELRYILARYQHVNLESELGQAIDRIAVALADYCSPAGEDGGGVPDRRALHTWRAAVVVGSSAVGVLAGITLLVWGLSGFRAFPAGALLDRADTARTATAPAPVPATSASSDEPAPAVPVSPAEPVVSLPAVWYVEALTDKSAYRPFVGMRTRYKVFLRQTGATLDVAGEKVGEVVRGAEKELVGKGRTPIHLAGHIEAGTGASFKIVLLGDESGTRRSGIATRYELTPTADHLLAGSFSTTAADAEGRVVWIPEGPWQARGWALSPPGKIGLPPRR